MLVEVQPLGDYLDSDEQGYLINPAAWQHIPKAWHLPIEAIKQAYQDFYKDALHSLYLRGSLVRGTYRAGISDVDVLALVQGAKRWQVVPFADTLEKGMEWILQCVFHLIERINPCFYIANGWQKILQFF